MTSEDKLLIDVRATLAKSKLYQLLNGLTSSIMVYPETTFDLKPKQQNKIAMLSSSMWKYHVALPASKHDAMGSILLQGKHMDITFLIKECATFCYHYETLISKSSTVKQMPELKKYYEELLSVKPKDILSALLTELFEYSQAYGFEIDKKSVVEQYNNHKNSFSSKG